MPTPEEAERQLVRRNATRKTLLWAGIPALLTFFGFAVNGGGWAVFGFFAAVGVFCGIGFYAGIFFAYSEKKDSKNRLAELAENKRIAEQQAKEAEQARQEQLRREAIREVEERSTLALLEQQRRNKRELVLTKLNAAANNVNLYDSSANFDTRARAMQVIENELSDINVNYTRSELTDLIERYPEVRDMMVTLRERLRARAIDSHQAAQILAALGNQGQSQRVRETTLGSDRARPQHRVRFSSKKAD
jgi:hypothetical protein